MCQSIIISMRNSTTFKIKYQNSVQILTKNERRREFFFKMRGRFISVSKLRRDMKLDGILEFLKIPIQCQTEIEEGSFNLTDEQFFRIITFLGCSNELPVFVEKLEKAMTPGVRESRLNLGNVLEIFGINFADKTEK